MNNRKFLDAKLFEKDSKQIMMHDANTYPTSGVSDNTDGKLKNTASTIAELKHLQKEIEKRLQDLEGKNRIGTLLTIYF
jgi:hypothetical protein